VSSIKNKLIKSIAEYYVILNKTSAAPSELHHGVVELSRLKIVSDIYNDYDPINRFLSLFRDSGLFDAPETVAMGIRKFKRDLKRPRELAAVQKPELDGVDSAKSRLDALVDSLDGSTPAAVRVKTDPDTSNSYSDSDSDSGKDPEWF
jgi:hypothetical protein